MANSEYAARSAQALRGPEVLPRIGQFLAVSRKLRLMQDDYFEGKRPLTPKKFASLRYAYLLEMSSLAAAVARSSSWEATLANSINLRDGVEALDGEIGMLSRSCNHLSRRLKQVKRVGVAALCLSPFFQLAGNIFFAAIPVYSIIAKQLENAVALKEGLEEIRQNAFDPSFAGSVASMIKQEALTIYLPPERR